MIIRVIREVVYEWLFKLTWRRFYNKYVVKRCDEILNNDFGFIKNDDADFVVGLKWTYPLSKYKSENSGTSHFAKVLAPINTNFYLFTSFLWWRAWLGKTTIARNEFLHHALKKMIRYFRVTMKTGKPDSKMAEDAYIYGYNHSGFGIIRLSAHTLWQFKTARCDAKTEIPFYSRFTHHTEVYVPILHEILTGEKVVMFVSRTLE